MKQKEKEIAINLRKQGLSYKAIVKLIKVSKSTLSLWLRDVELLNSQKANLLKSIELGRYKAAKNKKEQRIRATQLIIEEANVEFLKLVNNKLFLCGLMLYWAEGTKNKQEKVAFTNSDDKMVILMMKWFRDICRVPEDKFRIHLHVHDLHIRGGVIKYWSELTGISENQFYKTYIKKSSLRHRKNLLYNGTCTVRVNNKALFRRIVGWKIALASYFKLPS